MSQVPDGFFKFDDTSSVKLEVGDIIAIAGKYRKRTFWQWITQQPRELKRFEVVDEFPQEIMKQKKILLMERALNRLIHAYEDSIDNYSEIEGACEEGKKLLPNYKEKIIKPNNKLSAM